MSLQQQPDVTFGGGHVMNASQPLNVFDTTPSLCGLLDAMNINAKTHVHGSSSSRHSNGSSSSEPEFGSSSAVGPHAFLDDSGVPPQVASLIAITDGLAALKATGSIPECCLSPSELLCAKDLILELISYGVTPEYLGEIGVSAGTIYRVFTDLNLRLPTDLVF